MGSLLDIIPQSKKIEVNGEDIEVWGISAEGIANVLGRFPKLQELMQKGELKQEQLFKLIGNAVAPVIAAGCGFPGDKKAEDVASKLAPGVQVEFISAIWELSFPKGIGPLLEQVNSLNVGSTEASPKGRATK